MGDGKQPGESRTTEPKTPALVPACPFLPPPLCCAEELRLPLSALVSFPAYVSYSLPRRIAPRAAAARELGRDFAIQLLSRTDEAFAAWLGWEPEEWQVFAAAWQCKEDAARWADPQPPQPAALDCRDV